MKIDWGQIQFREYVSTGTEPKELVTKDSEASVEVPSGLIPGTAVIGEDGLPLGIPTGPIVGRDFKEHFENDLPEDLDRALFPESK